MNLRHLPLALLLTLATCAQAAAAQTCQTETAVPSTTPANRFLVHGDGTVTDTATGLTWAQCAEGLSGPACADGAAATFTWAEALIRARDSTHAGYTDWRLPTVKELSSIVEERCNHPAINLAVFPNTPSSGFWSASPYGFWYASPYGGVSNYAWGVNFSSGYAYDYGRDYGYHVRLVRSGQ
jgi:hypothetical protein